MVLMLSRVAATRLKLIGVVDLLVMAVSVPALRCGDRRAGSAQQVAGLEWPQ